MTMTKEKNIGEVEVREQENQIIFTDKDKQYISRKIMKNAGGPNAMTFGMGKSNAKVYVKSSEGIRFRM